MNGHSLLSPSGMEIWSNCTPSARLAAEYEDQGSDYARQGTDAHSLAQYKVECRQGLDTKDPTENLEYYDAEMESCCEDYATFVEETLSKVKETCEDPVILIEQHLDLSKYIPEGFGRGDCIIVGDGVLHIIDFKYGLGKLVSAEKNPQMMCYALGALELLDSLYDIKQVVMTIFQPRRDNVSSYSVTKEELLSWAEEVLIPTAKLAYAGEGEFKAGSHCQFCKAKANCRKRAEYNLEMAKYDFKVPDLLEDIEIAAILERADDLISWVDDIKTYALQQALSGTEYPGLKVVAGRSTRKYTDEDAVALAVTQAGFDPYEKKLLGVTAMTAQLGKKKFEELLGSLVRKAAGKPTLVPVSDKRPAMNTAADDFKENN